MRPWTKVARRTRQEENKDQKQHSPGLGTAQPRGRERRAAGFRAGKWFTSEDKIEDKIVIDISANPEPMMPHIV